MDDATGLMLRVKEGDDVAFDQLMTLFREPLVGTLYRLVNHRADAEDLAQEVFVRIYQSRERYEPSAKFSTWLYTIARNLAFNHLRQRQRERIVSITTGAEEDDWAREIAAPQATAPASSLREAELSNAIQNAIQELPPNQRAAIILARFEDKPYAEIAEILNTSAAAVKMLIKRARVTLTKRLRPFFPEENHA